MPALLDWLREPASPEAFRAFLGAGAAVVGTVLAISFGFSQLIIGRAAEAFSPSILARAGSDRELNTWYGLLALVTLANLAGFSAPTPHQYLFWGLFAVDGLSLSVLWFLRRRTVQLIDPLYHIGYIGQKGKAAARALTGQVQAYEERVAQERDPEILRRLAISFGREWSNEMGDHWSAIESLCELAAQGMKRGDHESVREVGLVIRAIIVEYAIARSSIVLLLDPFIENVVRRTITLARRSIDEGHQELLDIHISTLRETGKSAATISMSSPAAGDSSLAGLVATYAMEIAGPATQAGLIDSVGLLAEALGDMALGSIQAGHETSALPIVKSIIQVGACGVAANDSFPVRQAAGSTGRILFALAARSPRTSRFLTSQVVEALRPLGEVALRRLTSRSQFEMADFLDPLLDPISPVSFSSVLANFLETANFEQESQRRSRDAESDQYLASVGELLGVWMTASPDRVGVGVFNQLEALFELLFQVATENRTFRGLLGFLWVIQGLPAPIQPPESHVAQGI